MIAFFPFQHVLMYLKVFFHTSLDIFFFCSWQGYLLYRDTNNHSMTAIRINPETLEQDGTVALPGKNLQMRGIWYSLLCACYVFPGKQKRNWEILRSQIDYFMTLFHFRPSSVFHLEGLHLTPVAGGMLQHSGICDHLNLKTTWP